MSKPQAAPQLHANDQDPSCTIVCKDKEALEALERLKAVADKDWAEVGHPEFGKGLKLMVGWQKRVNHAQAHLDEMIEQIEKWKSDHEGYSKEKFEEELKPLLDEAQIHAGVFFNTLELMRCETLLMQTYLALHQLGIICSAILGDDGDDDEEDDEEEEGSEDNEAVDKAVEGAVVKTEKADKEVEGDGNDVEEGETVRRYLVLELVLVARKAETDDKATKDEVEEGKGEQEAQA